MASGAFRVEFKGALAKNDVDQMTADTVEENRISLGTMWDALSNFKFFYDPVDAGNQ